MYKSVRDRLHGANRFDPPPCVSFKQYARSGVFHRTTFAEHGNECLDVAKAQINPLPGERMNAVCGVAQQHETMRDRRRQPQVRERKAAWRRETLERAQHLRTRLRN